MEALAHLERKIFFVFEQPAQSYGFKLPQMQNLQVVAGMIPNWHLESDFIVLPLIWVPDFIMF